MKYNSICRIFGKKTGGKLRGSLIAYGSGFGIALAFNTMAAFNQIIDPNNIVYMPGFTPSGVVNPNMLVATIMSGAAVAMGVVGEVATQLPMRALAVPSRKGKDIVPAVQAFCYAVTVATGMYIGTQVDAQNQPKQHEMALKMVQKPS